MNMAGPVCFECEQGLSAFQRLRFRYFCSEKHNTDWVQEFNILGLLRLQEEGHKKKECGWVGKRFNRALGQFPP